MQEKGLFSLQMKDLFKGAALTAIGTLLTGFYTLLQNSGSFPTWVQFKPYVISAVSFFVSYLLKNYFSNNVGQLAKKDIPVKIVPADAVVIPSDKPQDTVPLPYNKNP